MATVLLTVSTAAELPQAVHMVQTAQSCFAQSESIIYVLDAEVNEQARGIKIVGASELLPKTYYKEAFLFKKEELRMRVAVCAAYKLCRDDNEVIFSMPSVVYANVCRPALIKNTIIAISAEAENTLPGVTANLADIHKIKSDVLMLGTGDVMCRYLKWCCDKMSWLFESTRLPYVSGNVNERDISEMHRDFMRNFLQYAALLGCGIEFKTAHELGATLSKPDKSLEYGFDKLDDGLPVFDMLRDYYGIDYRLRQACGENPFEHVELFTATQALTGDTHPVIVPPIAMALYSRRDDVRSTFRQPFGADREAFINWFCSYGAAEKGIDEAWTAPLKARLDAYIAQNTANDELYRSLSYRIKNRLGMVKYTNALPAARPPFGVNLCGFIKGDFGLGEATRILADILDAEQIPFTIIDFEGAVTHSYTNSQWDEKISNKFIYNTNLMLTNADGLPIFLQTVAPETMKGRYNIGFWYWELPDFPDEMAKSFDLVNEVWTSSEFSAEAMRRKANGKPVTVVPCSVKISCDEALTRADFGIPEDKFAFLTMYDVRSSNARKNPQASVEAFTKAFGEREDVVLVIKLNAAQLDESTREVQQLIDGHKNIMLLCGTYPSEKINALVKLCDAFLSLHRSEGFGLGPAEAMYFGRPAVLTNYSGNTQYMKPGACCPVKYKMVEIDKDYGVYKKGGHWAEADTEDAASQMKRLVDDKAFYESVSQKGEQVIKTEFSPAAIGKTVKQRLNELHLY